MATLFQYKIINEVQGRYKKYIANIKIDTVSIETKISGT